MNYADPNIINESHLYSNSTAETNMLPVRTLYKRRWITTVNGGYRVLSFDQKDIYGDFATCEAAMAWIDQEQARIPSGMTNAGLSDANSPNWFLMGAVATAGLMFGRWLFSK